MANILITGGTGFIGRALCRELGACGYRIFATSRRPDTVPASCGSSVVGVGDPAQVTEPLDGVVNLAGASIAGGRWTQARKQILRSSRLGTTAAVIEYLRKASTRPKVLISASAVGVYGDRGDEVLDEHASAGDDFLARLCVDWESAASKAEELGITTTLLRIGLVLGPGGGLMARLKLPYQFGLGGRLGSGRQWMSWIGLSDLVALVRFLLEHPVSGPVNATAPQPVTQAEFARTLASTLGRPAPWRIPAFALSLLFGEMASTLLAGQRAVPRRLETEGFTFSSPGLRETLGAAL